MCRVTDRTIKPLQQQVVPMFPTSELQSTALGTPVPLQHLSRAQYCTPVGASEVQGAAQHLTTQTTRPYSASCRTAKTKTRSRSFSIFRMRVRFRTADSSRAEHSLRCSLLNRLIPVLGVAICHPIVVLLHVVGTLTVLASQLCGRCGRQHEWAAVPLMGLLHGRMLVRGAGTGVTVHAACGCGLRCEAVAG